MNKLTDMIATAAKLAAQNPTAGEALEWSTDALARAITNWYDAEMPLAGSCLLVDVAPEGLSLRRPAQAQTNLVCTSRPLPSDGEVPADWRLSQRLPSDLRHGDAELLQRAQSASSVLALQLAMSASPKAEAWIADDSIQTIVAPFLLNVLNGAACEMALAEMSRVLSRGGNLESLILAADEPLDGARITCHGQDCSAFPQEHEVADILLAAGLHGVSLQPLLDRPYMIVNGVELRVFALRAHTGTKGVCLEQGDAAIYLGPWSEVQDDDGHIYPRGRRIAVCAKTAQVLQRPPYAGSFEIIQAYDRPPLETAEPFDCSRDVIRPVAETKGRVAIGSLPPGLSPPASPCTDTDCGC